MTTKNKGIDRNEIATLMGCKAASAISRLVALGYTEVCGRCGGSGQYSWNQVDGSRCFGCAGAGKVLAKITAAVVTEALARIEAGELTGYFAENKARREIKTVNEELWADYMATRISHEYTVASRTPDAAAFLETPIYRAQDLLNRIMDSAAAAMHDRGVAHAVRIAIIRQAHAMALEIDRAWASR